MWPTRSLGQRLQNSSLQLVGHNIWATTWQHGTMALPKQRLRCQLVKQWPNRLLPGQWATTPAAPTNTTTCAYNTSPTSSARATGANNTSCGSTGQQDVNNTIDINTSVSPTGWRTLWSTVEQQHMFVHHGLHPTHPCTHCNMDKRATTKDSNRWKHLSVWIQVGLDDQRQQATTGCSLLCVWSDTTHHVSNKTGWARV